jgi:hypothetical protein
VPDAKEPHFFDKYYHKGLAYYERKFFNKVQPSHRIRIDFTPMNLYRKTMAGRIHESLGSDLKLFVILRDPAKRAYSQYHMSMRRGHDVFPFNEAIQNGDDRVRNEYTDRLLSYISRGYYFQQISEYLEFFPLNQFHFIIFEDFVKDPEAQIKGLLEFLGLSTEVDLDYHQKSNENYPIKSILYARLIRNISRIFYEVNFRPDSLRKLKKWLHSFNKKEPSRIAKQAPPDFRSINNKYFKEDIRKLSLLLGRDLGLVWEVDLQEGD